MQINGLTFSLNKKKELVVVGPSGANEQVYYGLKGKTLEDKVEALKSKVVIGQACIENYGQMALMQGIELPEFPPEPWQVFDLGKLTKEEQAEQHKRVREYGQEVSRIDAERQAIMAKVIEQQTAYEFYAGKLNDQLEGTLTVTDWLGINPSLLGQLAADAYLLEGKG